MIREPAVAGRFYPDDPDECKSALEDCLRDERSRPVESQDVQQYDRIIGGIVPHAGWICSGAVAARVIDEIARREKPDAVVVFGAVHVRNVPVASIYSTGAWQTPLGLAPVDQRLGQRLREKTNLLVDDPSAHAHEHSIEVEVPFIQSLLPDSLILPIMVPVDENASVLGTAVGNVCKNFGARVVFLASTDLTHYGPSYGFTPEGVGQSGLQWAKDVNDRRMIDLMLAMRDEQAVSEAIGNQNACGAGAIAATIAACKAYGASRATLLEHTTSFEVLSRLAPQSPRDAVGYAGIVFG